MLLVVVLLLHVVDPMTSPSLKPRRGVKVKTTATLLLRVVVYDMRVHECSPTIHVLVGLVLFLVYSCTHYTLYCTCEHLCIPYTDVLL